MKTKLDKKNPYSYGRYGFIWEKLNQIKPGLHLDYGAFNGSVLKFLKETNVIVQGFGVDANETIVFQSKNNLPKGVTLIACSNKERLPFADNYFDSISILDVIEHVHDQKSLLQEMNRLLKADGVLIVTVPRKNIFSFLDTGNFKFKFPKLHRTYYEFKYSKKEYHERYVECKNGLFGDIEIGKMWHQHFSEKEMESLLNENGFKISCFDGSGFLSLFLIIIGDFLPFLRPLLKHPIKLDQRIFEKSNLFCLATKSDNNNFRN